jgi:hypothetical protein
MPRSLVGALALLLSLALWAAGATGAWGDPLHNVRAVKLTMPEPGEAAEACGLSREALESAFFKPLAERGIQVVTSGTGYRVFLRAITISYLEETCVSYIDAQLLLTTRYQDTANQQERSGHVQLWADGGLFASDRREHSATLEREMRRLGGSLAERWDAAN